MKNSKGQATIGLNGESFKARNLKGQAAMEYLMTYGWALLVIAVVIAALFFLTQNLFKIEGCTFQPTGFSCGDASPQVYVDADNKVSIAIRVYNQFGQTVLLKSVACTVAATGEVTTGMQIPPKNITGGMVDKIGAGGSVVLRTPCVDSANKQVSLTPGSQFRGHYIIWYNFNNDPDQSKPRLAIGTVAGPVLK